MTIKHPGLDLSLCDLPMDLAESMNLLKRLTKHMRFVLSHCHVTESAHTHCHIDVYSTLLWTLIIKNANDQSTI